MAYSNWGAYIWKNGENITKQAADKGFTYISGDKKWYENAEVDDLDIEGLPHAGGHAVLVLDNFALEFYKIYSPKIVFKTGKTIQTHVIENDEIYENKTLSLKINGMYINSHENIVEFNIKHKNDVYGIIVGMSIGNGYDKTNTSKFIKKYNKYIPENECYHLKHKWVEKTDTWHVLDYLERLDDIKDEKSSRWVFGIKPFFKDLIRFKFRDALFHLDRIYEGNIKIKLLK